MKRAVGAGPGLRGGEVLGVEGDDEGVGDGVGGVGDGAEDLKRGGQGDFGRAGAATTAINAADQHGECSIPAHEPPPFRVGNRYGNAAPGHLTSRLPATRRSESYADVTPAPRRMRTRVTDSARDGGADRRGQGG